MFDQAELRRREEQRLVGRSRDLRRAVGGGVNVIGARKRPETKTGEGRCHRSDADVAENFATFDALSGHDDSSSCTRATFSMKWLAKISYTAADAESNRGMSGDK